MLIASFDVGIRNLAYCIMDEKCNIVDWSVVDVLENKTTKVSKMKQCIFMFAKCVANVLDTIDMSNCNRVIIEHQPSRNNKMKAMGNIIIGYLATKYHDKPNNWAIFVAPRNKLKVYDGPSIDCHLKNKYGQNKYYAKEHCKYFLNKLNIAYRWKLLYNDSKKKDDLADSYLQGMWYIKNNTKIHYGNIIIFGQLYKIKLHKTI